jgi:hypothetical protein
MKTRVLFLCLAALAIFALLIGLPGAAQAQAVGPCGPTVVQSGNVFTITPNGFDDTASIQCALDAAAAAGPGSTVQLVKGTFYTRLIDVNGFNGTLKGMGIDKTKIEALPDLNCAEYPALLNIKTDKIRVADLTISIPSEAPCSQQDGGILFAVLSINRTFTDTCDSNEIQKTDVTVDSVAIHGNTGDIVDTGLASNVVVGIDFESPDNWNILDCPNPGARLGGTFRVFRSRIDQVLFPVFTRYLKDARLQIGGAPNLGNTFDRMVTLLLHSNTNTFGIVSYNQFTQVYFSAVNMLVVPPVDAPSNYLIDHNSIGITNWGNGVVLQDYNLANGIPAGLSASITHNTIEFTGTDQWGVAGNYAENVLVANNRFTGSGGAGIVVGIYGYEGDPLTTTQRWLIRGNNFNKAQFSWVPIALTNTSAHIVVIGGNNKDNVENNGTDNIISGVTIRRGQLLGKMLEELKKHQAGIEKMIPNWR